MISVVACIAIGNNSSLENNYGGFINDVRHERKEGYYILGCQGVGVRPNFMVLEKGLIKYTHL